MKVQVKQFRGVSDEFHVNKFLTEIGDRFVSITTTPFGSSNSSMSYSIVYKIEEDVKENSNKSLLG